MYPSFSTLFINFWEFYSFPSNYFPSLYGKNSTIFHSKLHPNITTKDMSSSDKCNHPLTTWFSLYPFFFHSLLEFTFSAYQRQRYHTPNKQKWWKVVSRRCLSLHINPLPPPPSPKISTIRCQVSNNFLCSILFFKRFLTLSVIRNNSIHSLIQLWGTKHSHSCTQ